MQKAGRRLVLAAAGVLALMGAPTQVAQAAEQVDTYVVTGAVGADGTVAVEATISFDQTAPASLQQVFSTATRTSRDTEYHYVVSDVTASSGSTTLTPTVTVDARTTTVTIPTAGLTEPVKLSYKVTGAAVAGPEGTTVVSWPLLQGLNLPVKEFEATIGVPAQFTLIDCAAGDPDSPGGCSVYGGGTHEHANPYFRDDNRAAGEVVVMTFRFPKGAVQVNQDLREIWTLGGAFSAAPLPLGVALALAVLGGLALWLLHRRFGRDAATVAHPTLVAQFRPVAAGQSEFEVLDAVRPGEVGTLIDERVDPIDITATVLDLAVRGHLRIEELPRPTPHSPTDWTFTRREGDGALLGYETALLEAIAPTEGASATVSTLSGSVSAVIGTVQSQLYDEVAERGWFVRRPDATRSSWGLIGWIGLGVALLVTVLLAAFTHFGLAGLALIGLALGLLLLAQEMPRRTTSGRSILAGLDVLRGSLLTQPTDTLPGKGLDQLSAILPYAVVLGGRERWLQAMVDSDSRAAVLEWYRGPAGWTLNDLPASLANFVTTVQGTLFSR